MPYKQAGILLSLYSGSGTDRMCHVSNCPIGTRLPGRSHEEFWFLLCSWMAQSLTLLRTLLLRQSTLALRPLQVRCWALPHRPSQHFPCCRQGNALGQWVRGRRHNATASSCSRHTNKTGFSSDASPHLSQGVHIPVRLSTTPFVF